MADMTNEKGVKRAVKQLLDKHGFYWWMPAANGYGTTGVSDFCAIKNGVFLVVETKFGRNKPSPMQKRFAESILASGGIALAVNETHIHVLDIFLSSFDLAASAVARREAVDPEAGASMLDAFNALTELFK